MDFWIPSSRCRYLPYSLAEASEEKVMHNSVIVTESINTSHLCCGSNIGETPKKQPFLRRGVKKSHRIFRLWNLPPLAPRALPLYFFGEHPIRLRDTAGGESQNAVQKTNAFVVIRLSSFLYICRISETVRHSQAENVIFACLCAHLSLYLWNVRVEWHSWKYDSLLPLHFSFTIFELKLENTSARQNKIKASFVLLSSRLYVSLSLRR